MKQLHKFSLAFLFLIVLSSFTMHKFYVSVTEIEQNEKKERIEITSRIFIDDLEKVLEKNTQKKLKLATKQELPEAKKIVQDYVVSCLKLEINKKEKELVFLGSEYDNDVLICYLKANNSQKITTFGFQNKLLLDLNADQQNLVHTNINNNKKSFLLTKSEQNALIAN